MLDLLGAADAFLEAVALYFFCSLYSSFQFLSTFSHKNSTDARSLSNRLPLAGGFLEIFLGPPNLVYSLASEISARSSAVLRSLFTAAKSAPLFSTKRRTIKKCPF